MEDRTTRENRLQQKLDKLESDMRNLQPKKGIVKRNIENEIIMLKDEIKKTVHGNPDTWNKDL